MKNKVLLDAYSISSDWSCRVEFDSIKDADIYIKRMNVLYPFDFVFKFMNCESKR